MNPTVVVCRPSTQARATLELLRTAGIACEALSLIEIVSLAPDAVALARLGDVAKPVVAAIFVSQNAVAHGLRWLRPSPETRLMAVGAGTKAALLESGAIDPKTVIAPSDDGDSEDSEGVLRLAPLQALHGRAVLLVRGESQSNEGVVSAGRGLLAATLRARGADLIELVCYRRNKRALEPETRVHWQTCMRESTLAAWVIGSVETLDAWMDAFGDQPNALKQVFLVPHERVARAARARGFASVTITSLAPSTILQSVTQLPPLLRLQ